MAAATLLEPAAPPDLLPREEIPGVSGSASATLQNLLAEVRGALSFIADEAGPLGDALEHHLGNPGKQLRARLALGSCEALDVDRPAAISLAVACELLHEASLVHDDLQDGDRVRRGQESVWWRFGRATAINVGDFLLTQAWLAVARIPTSAGARAALLELFGQAVLQTIRGQEAEGAASGSPELSLGAYEAMSRAKTGPLLSLPVLGALVLAGRPRSLHAAAREALESVGVAYQILDDLQDLGGSRGTDASSDLEEGRPSAPILHFLLSADEAARERLLSLWQGKAAGRVSVDDALERILRSDAVERCLAQLASLRSRARLRAEELPEPLATVLLAFFEIVLDERRLEGARAVSRSQRVPVQSRGRAVEIPVFA